MKKSSAAAIDRLRHSYLALRASHGDGGLWTDAGAGLAAQMSGVVIESSGQVFASAASIAALWDTQDAVSFGAANVLIVGQRGTGKEAIAQVIASTLGVEMVSVNCATLVQSLADAELFGVGGGAGLPGVPAAGSTGYVSQAQGGVLFLDEIFDAPFLFPKLLRLLQQRAFSRVADPETRTFQGTIIAASNRFPDRRSVHAAVRAGDLRADLVDRFLLVDVPPLASRREEIAVLADHHLARLHARLPACPFDRLDAVTARALSRRPYPWPGNLRELNAWLHTQAQLRRHRAPDGRGHPLRIPIDDLERLLPVSADATADVAPGDLSAWSRQGVRALRRTQLRRALEAARDAEGQAAVDTGWVAQRARRLLGVTGNISEKLRSAGTTCSELAAMLDRSA